jgi:nucleotide-binding universal stress UspA family protein
MTLNIHVPLQSILVATNLSDTKWLLPFVSYLAQESGARVTFLYVVTPAGSMTIDQSGFPYFDADSAITSMKEELESCCAGMHWQNIRHETMVVTGETPETILSAIGPVGADILVMGTRGHRGIEKWLLGSVAESVLRSSPIPVITIGPNARRAAVSPHPVKSILLASSLKTKSTDSARLANLWRERLNARLTLLHVTPKDRGDALNRERTCKAREEELRTLLPEHLFEEGLAGVQIQSGSPSREILLASAHADLIMLGALRQPPLKRFAPEGILYQVLSEARCPVATLHSEHAKESSLGRRAGTGFSS